nr:MAG TPA: hypothetical protein [Crassvirales sp.]
MLYICFQPMLFIAFDKLILRLAMTMNLLLPAFLFAIYLLSTKLKQHETQP